MEYAIAKLVSELKSLQGSDGARLMNTAGNTEAAWQIYLEQKRISLETELATIISNITAAKKEKDNAYE